MADVLLSGVSGRAMPPTASNSVMRNPRIAASFAINTHTITATAGANGSISPSGAVSVNHGASQTFTITPAAGYHVADVLRAGERPVGEECNSLSKACAEHTRAARFGSATT